MHRSGQPVSQCTLSMWIVSNAVCILCECLYLFLSSVNTLIRIQRKTIECYEHSLSLIVKCRKHGIVYVHDIIRYNFIVSHSIALHPITLYHNIQNITLQWTRAIPASPIFFYQAKEPFSRCNVLTTNCVLWRNPAHCWTNKLKTKLVVKQ